MPQAQPTKVAAVVLSDVGMVREHNEDNAHIDDQGMFFVVADGMGGHAAGEVASAMAVDEVRAALDAARAKIRAFGEAPSEDGRSQLVALLEDAVRRAHQAVFDRGGRESDKKGMGTTLDVLLVAGGEAFVAHVGDSRTYLLRGGAAAQVTTDHTVAEVLVIEGKLTPEEARLSPLRTILVNAIGVSPDVGVELAHLKLRRGDQLLLCSDGLHDYYPAESELAEVLAVKQGIDGLTQLVEQAKDRGGHDNITGVLIHVVQGNPTVEEEEAEARRAAEELDAQSSEDRAAAPTELLGVEETAPHDDDGPTIRRSPPPAPSPPPAKASGAGGDGGKKPRKKRKTKGDHEGVADDEPTPGKTLPPGARTAKLRDGEAGGPSGTAAGAGTSAPRRAEGEMALRKTEEVPAVTPESLGVDAGRKRP
jgi:serine/threonine protein phosphatase PrpC